MKTRSDTRNHSSKQTSASRPATMNLPQGRPWSDLDPGTRLTPQLARAYRHRHPPAAPEPALAALLDSIPMPDVDYCSPAMQQLPGADRTDGR